MQNVKQAAHPSEYPPAAGAAFDSAHLYDALAPGYDAGYATATFQRAYDQLAWSRVIALLPPRPCTSSMPAAAPDAGRSCWCAPAIGSSASSNRRK